MKKNIIIGILIVIVLGLGGFIVYDNFFNKNEENVKTSEHENTNNNQNEDKTDEINDTNEDDLTNIESDSYIHFTKTELMWSNGASIGINLEIKSGKLTETSGKNFNISGIDGEVKYFTYDITCDGIVGLLVITEDNNLYASEFNLSDSDLIGKNLVFQKISTNEKIVDITRYVNIYPTTCDGNYLAAVLNDGKVYAVEGYNDSSSYNLDNYDYSKYKDVYDGFVIYSDNSFENMTSKINGSKVKYNGEIIKVKNIYIIESQVAVYVLNENNMLYKIEKTTDNYPDNTVKNISLVKNSPVVSITNSSSKDAMNVLYEDGTTATLKVDLRSGYYSLT